MQVFHPFATLTAYPECDDINIREMVQAGSGRAPVRHLCE